jgi:asparagine synthase (glutamine-hydrolysing)
MQPSAVASSGFCGRFQPASTGAPSAPASPLWRAWGALAIGFAATDGTGPVALAWWGELHNAPALRSELALDPAAPLEQLLLKAWQQWSIDALQRLDGVFTIAVRDADTLVLYRDPSGLRNLFFSPQPEGAIAFATDLDALPTPPDAPRRVARRALHEYLRLGDIAAPATLFSGVIAVEAGQVLRCSAAGVAPIRQPPPPPRAAPPLHFADAVDRLDTLLQHGVRSRLEGAARPAAFLSGGIDSSLLCAIGARLRPDLTAITVGFDTAPYDEAPVAERVARHLGLAHEVWRFSRDDYLAGFERLSRGAEHPNADPAAMATVLAFDRCRSRFDVVIDGTGADESVGMMPPRHVRFAVAHASRLPGGVRRGLAGLLRRNARLSGYLPLVDFDHPADTMVRWPAFARAEVADLCGEAVSLEHSQFYRTFDKFPRAAHFERYSALVEAMPCDRLNQAMRISGASVRFPFWAIDADRFVRQLRPSHRYLPGEPKRILRGVLSRYVPQAVWDIPKHGFNFPVREFLAGDDFSLVRQFLDPGFWHHAPWLVPARVAHWAQRFMAGEPGMTFRVWRLVVLAAWLQHHPEALETK